MFAINHRLTATLILTLMLATTARAQETQTAPAAKEPESTTVIELVKRIFNLHEKSKDDIKTGPTQSGPGK